VARSWRNTLGFVKNTPHSSFELSRLSPSIGGKPDDQANDEDEDEDNKALSKSPTDDQVVPAHVRRPLSLHVLVQHLLGQGLLGKVLLVEDLLGEDLLGEDLLGQQ